MTQATAGVGKVAWHQVLARPTWLEHIRTLLPQEGETSQSLLARGLAEVAREGESPLKATLFGPQLPEAPGSDCPVTVVSPSPGEPGDRVAGLVIHSLSGAQVHSLTAGGRVIGRWFDEPEGRRCLLGGVTAADLSGAPGEQTLEVLQGMHDALSSIGMGFGNIARTWFFNRDILGWYDEFNAVRTGFFREHGIFDRLVPASTGIAGLGVPGAALMAEAIAIRPASDSLAATTMDSPRQRSAREYGSSFSRAVCIDDSRTSHALVSGTASISPDGRSIHVGNFAAQVELTMGVVEAILLSRGMVWTDVVRSIAYVKDEADLPRLPGLLASLGVPSIPMVITRADVCRHDLLYEIELDAAQAC